MSTAANLLKFVWACWKLNLSGAMEYRMSFFLTAGMMVVNNVVWIFYWGVYFTKFPVVNGWELQDVMMMWAVSAGGFGLSAVLFGNSYAMSTLIANGQLDTYLTQPKPVLLHVLISRMSVSAIGDVVFGLMLYALFGDHTLAGLLKFGFGLALATTIFIFFNVIAQSLAFYIGNAEGIGQQVFIGFVTFSTYPTDIFRGLGRLVLFTVIPAGFISYLPIGLLREVKWTFLAGAAGMALLVTAVGVFVFYRGLRRYSSGNMMSMRG
ncbi:ABC-2 family transporter protein [Paenibacillus sp. GYB004]|uniref:ABC transporter permease n=1 Tax=Paenibacillus sp. GYB004 TaxID=2994393 RepID=UPI002F96134A